MLDKLFLKQPSQPERLIYNSVLGSWASTDMHLPLLSQEME